MKYIINNRGKLVNESGGGLLFFEKPILRFNEIWQAEFVFQGLNFNADDKFIIAIDDDNFLGNDLVAFCDSFVLNTEKSSVYFEIETNSKKMLDLVNNSKVAKTVYFQILRYVNGDEKRKVTIAYDVCYCKGSIFDDDSSAEILYPTAVYTKDEIDEILKTAPELEYSADGLSWHTEQDKSDNYIRFKVNKSAWSPAFKVGTVSGGDSGTIDGILLNGEVVPIINKIANINIKIPKNISELNNDADFVNTKTENLTNYLLKGKTGTSIGLDINTENYVLTVKLLNPNGDVLSEKAVDFPLESVVVNGVYNNGTLTLTLKNGNSIDVNISDLISGLVPETRTINGKNLSSDISITAEDLSLSTVARTGAYSDLAGQPTIPKALSDLNDDSSHRLVTDTEKDTWNEKQKAITESNKLDYSLVSNTPAIPTVNNPTITLTQGGKTKGSFTLNQSGNATIDFDAGGNGEENVIETVKVNGTALIVTDKAVDITVPTALADLSDDSSHRLVTDTEKDTWNAKSDFSGSFNDLTDQPTIPTVYNGTITLTQGGKTKGSFTLNQSGNATIDFDAGGGSGGEATDFVNVLETYDETEILSNDGVIYTVSDYSSDNCGRFYTKYKVAEKLSFWSTDGSGFDAPPSGYEFNYDDPDYINNNFVLARYYAIFRKYYNNGELVTTTVDGHTYPVWVCAGANAHVLTGGMIHTESGVDMKGKSITLSNSVYIYATAGSQAKGWGATTDPANIGNYIGFGEGPVGLCYWDWENPNTVPALNISEGTTIGWEYNGVECNWMENCGNLPTDWPTAMCMAGSFMMSYIPPGGRVLNIGARHDVSYDYNPSISLIIDRFAAQTNQYGTLTSLTITFDSGLDADKEYIFYFSSPEAAGCALTLGNVNTALVASPEAGKEYVLVIRNGIAVGENL